MGEPKIKQRSQFVKVLKRYGFNKLLGHDAYNNDSKGWFAEIIYRGNYCDVWMTGMGLKSITGYPGGWIYSSAEELEKELNLNKRIR